MFSDKVVNSADVKLYKTGNVYGLAGYVYLNNIPANTETVIFKLPVQLTGSVLLPPFSSYSPVTMQYAYVYDNGDVVVKIANAVTDSTLFYLGGTFIK